MSDIKPAPKKAYGKMGSKLNPGTAATADNDTRTIVGVDINPIGNLGAKASGRTENTHEAILSKLNRSKGR